jgi:hypothetical protein
MASPFPGMDPYLELPAYWDDFHATFIISWRRAINKLLPRPYHAQLNVKANLIEVDAATTKLVIPDVSLLRSKHGVTEFRNDSSVSTLEPVTCTLPLCEEVKEYRIEVMHAPSQKMVAILELLSPWNKASGDGRLEYGSKRAAIIKQDVHLIEVDLLLGGRRLLMLEPLPPGDYYALISRSYRRPKSEVYAWSLRDRMPRIPLPLLSADRDVSIDLAEVFADAYESGGYGGFVNYVSPPVASIPEIHRDWVMELAKSATPR